MFALFELIMIFAFLWLIANILHFIFFKGTGGSFFFLSQKWYDEGVNKGQSRKKNR